MPGFTSTTRQPQLRTCHDGTYLWAMSTSSYDADDVIPAYVRLDDQIANEDGKLVYRSPFNNPEATSKRRSSTTSSSEGSTDSDIELEQGWGKQRGEFSEKAVSVELSGCGRRLIAILPRNGSTKDQVTSEIDLDSILACEDGEFSWM